jgi:hypothetical protein
MKKIALFAVLAFTAPAFASDFIGLTIEPLAYSLTTTSDGVSGKVVVLTSDNAGTQAAPTVATDGLDLKGLAGVTVMLKTASNATAGGTLQAYVLNPETSAWYRVPDLDLTATATTVQSWPGLYVPVPKGRVYWVPSGIGSVVTTIYLIGQEK